MITGRCDPTKRDLNDGHRNCLQEDRKVSQFPPNHHYPVIKKIIIPVIKKIIIIVIKIFDILVIATIIILVISVKIISATVHCKDQIVVDGDGEW